MRLCLSKVHYEKKKLRRQNWLFRPIFISPPAYWKVRLKVLQWWSKLRESLCSTGCCHSGYTANNLAKSLLHITSYVILESITSHIIYWGQITISVRWWMVLHPPGPWVLPHLIALYLTPQGPKWTPTGSTHTFIICFFRQNVFWDCFVWGVLSYRYSDLKTVRHRGGW